MEKRAERDARRLAWDLLAREMNGTFGVAPAKKKGWRWLWIRHGVETEWIRASQSGWPIWIATRKSILNEPQTVIAAPMHAAGGIRCDVHRTGTGSTGAPPADPFDYLAWQFAVWGPVREILDVSDVRAAESLFVHAPKSSPLLLVTSEAVLVQLKGFVVEPALLRLAARWVVSISQRNSPALAELLSREFDAGASEDPLGFPPILIDSATSITAVKAHRKSNTPGGWRVDAQSSQTIEPFSYRPVVDGALPPQARGAALSEEDRRRLGSLSSLEAKPGLVSGCLGFGGSPETVIAVARTIRRLADALRGQQPYR